jgi:hypothetical protein
MNCGYLKTNCVASDTRVCIVALRRNTKIKKKVKFRLIHIFYCNDFEVQGKIT